MKINKYINAFIATAVMAAGFASCTNDDTVDDKELYVISLKTTGLDEQQQSEFEKVVKSKTFGVDVIDAHQQTYGLRSSEGYARARYQEMVASSLVLDSIVNVYADQSNNVDFSVNVVLMKDSTSVLQTSDAIKPTIERENYTIKVEQTDGKLDADGLASLAKMTQDVLGIAPNSQSNVSCTPGYVKTQYLSTLASALADSITMLVPEKGSPVIFEDFAEKITVLKGSEEVGVVNVVPYCDYTAWFEVEKGSLTDDDAAQLYGEIKQEIFSGMDAYPWDKRQKMTRTKAGINYTNLMITNNNAIQTIVNNFAAEKDIKDFVLKFHFSVADGVTAPVSHEWKTFEDYDLGFTALIEKDNFKVEYEVAAGSLSESNLQVVKDALAGLYYPVLDDVYAASAIKAYEGFLGSSTEFVDAETGDAVKVQQIAQYLAKKTKTLDFIITLKLVDSKGNSVEKIILKANEGWKTGN